MENTFKFLTDRGLEQYDAYINATYAKKGEAGDSVFVKANFTSIGNEYEAILIRYFGENWDKKVALAKLEKTPYCIKYNVFVLPTTLMLAVSLYCLIHIIPSKKPIIEATIKDL